MKTFIHNTKIFLDQNDTFSNQSKWGFLKYEIRRRSIAFSKALAKKSKKEHALLLPKITKLEQVLAAKKNLMNMIKQRTNLKKYMIALLKV